MRVNLQSGRGGKDQHYLTRGMEWSAILEPQRGVSSIHDKVSGDGFI